MKVNFSKIMKIPLFSESFKKLCIDESLSVNERTFLLTCAKLFIDEYEKNTEAEKYLDIAYYIILKYSTAYGDYSPLYDFSVNFGYYPIAASIYHDDKINVGVESALVNLLIECDYEIDNVVKTFEQKKACDGFVTSNDRNIAFIAPTSYGKSRSILDRIHSDISNKNRIGIIVPSKSLLAQTYDSVRNENFGCKILIHDEMYEGQNRFVAVFTQERALRLLDKNKDLFFDTLYIDEADRIFKNDSRSILISRLIRTNELRNESQTVVYLSPFISDIDNLKRYREEFILEDRIKFNMKEPEIFEYTLSGNVRKFNRYSGEMYYISECSDFFRYILEKKKNKSFIYINTPKKIERFSKEFAEKSAEINDCKIEEMVRILSEYIHEDFSLLYSLRKGIVYVHGLMPDNIKEYLEYKFSETDAISVIVGNNVILEGINLPIDSLFVLNTLGRTTKELMNLIGRVNRLKYIFSTPADLSKLLLPVHFVNSEEYGRKGSNMEKTIRNLRNEIADDVINPLLFSYNPNNLKKNTRAHVVRENQKIIKNEAILFNKSKDRINLIKAWLISHNIYHTYHDLSDSLCLKISKKVSYYKDHKSKNMHAVDLLRDIFVIDLVNDIKDLEFKRLERSDAVNAYKYILDALRFYPINQRIKLDIDRFIRKSKTDMPYLYVGSKYGEISQGGGSDAYVDLRTKTVSEMVSISLLSQKIESDFISYKLNMFFQFMFDNEILSEDEYNNLLYGSSDPEILRYVKSGLTLSNINRLKKDGQLKNINFTDVNIPEGNNNFAEYLKNVDDLYRFELKKYISIL